MRDESGSALVELALTLSIVGVPLLLGTAHFAVLLVNSIIVSNAAHAGAEYGMQSSTYAANSNIANIQAAARDDSGLGTNLNVTSNVFYDCSLAIGGSEYTTAAAANTVCTGSSGHTLEFIQVTASATVTPVAHVPGFPNTVTLSSTSVMEVQE